MRDLTYDDTKEDIVKLAESIKHLNTGQMHAINSIAEAIRADDSYESLYKRYTELAEKVSEAKKLADEVSDFLGEMEVDI